MAPRGRRSRSSPIPASARSSNGAGTAANTDVVAISATHVNFEGFEVRGATRSGIPGVVASDVALVDNVIHDAVRGGIWVGSDRWA